MDTPLNEYRISDLDYIAEEGYWSVNYELKANKRVSFNVHVFDKTKKAWVIESDPPSGYRDQDH